MESHLVSYPMQYRVFPKIQATALLMRGALKLELVHTLYPAGPGQDNWTRKEKTTLFAVNLMRSQVLYRAARWGCRIWHKGLSQNKTSAGAAQQMT